MEQQTKHTGFYQIKQLSATGKLLCFYLGPVYTAVPIQVRVPPL
jgi:hypothetical protein